MCRRCFDANGIQVPGILIGVDVTWINCEDITFNFGVILYKVIDKLQT